MKAKVKLPILFFFFIAFGANAQISSNANGSNNPQIRKGLPNSFEFSVISTDDVFVLDSTIHLKKHNDHMDTTKYYYTYDKKGNKIEEIIYTTIIGAASGLDNSRIQYLYDENDSVIGYFRYDLEPETKKWIPHSKSEITYSFSENKIVHTIFKYDTITKKWISNIRFEYIKNGYGNVISDTRYYWDESLEWYPCQKEETNYDEQGRFLGMVWYNWDELQNKLEYSRKRVQEYNEDGTYVTIKYYDYDKNTNSWIGDEFSEIFLEGKNIKTYIMYGWNNESDQWDYHFKLEYTYDLNGNETSDAAYSWDTTKNAWEGNYKTETSYNSNGLLESVSNYITDTTNQWVGIDKKEYFYNESGKEILSINSNWNVAANDWIVSSKTEREYNSGNKEIERVGYGWDTTINDWVFSSKNEKEYNSNNQVILSTSFKWDTIGKDWKITGQNTLEYDIYGHNTKSSKYVVYEDDVLELTETNEYFYSKLITNINNIISESETIKLYPNPVNETFTIETQNPEISFGKLYNLNGELVKNLTIEQGTNTYNISGLQSGVYFIQIPQKEGMFVKKLVKN